MAEPMIQVVKDGSIEQFEKAMPSHHWLRNKKQTVHYIHDTPFATERQLEDQRLLMQKNRNPQFLIPTKVDKVRSQVIASTLGASRPEAVKANVLNKIVREASGVHNYTIVAPVRSTTTKAEYEKLEPETNPRVRPYAKEAKMKPILCSFGHRPRSASRTFHPATMRFRLKHNEIAHGGDNVYKTGFGLPVSVLKQVLKAPKIYHGDASLFGGDSATLEDHDSLDVGEEQGSLYAGGENDNANELKDLFFTEAEQKKMFQPLNKDRKLSQGTNNGSNASHPSNTGKNHSPADMQGQENSLEKPSWVSTEAGKAAGKMETALSPGGGKVPAIVYPKLEEPYNDGRPSWDEAHHRIRLPSNHVFQMRASGLNTDAQKLSLGDRLKRFSALSVAETQPVLFCTEKQQTDKKIMAGIEHKVPKATSHNGLPVFIDPNNNELAMIKHYRKLDLQEEKRRQKAKDFQKLLKTIPVVEYFPTTRLAEMYAKNGVTSSGMLSSIGADSMYSSSAPGVIDASGVNDSMFSADNTGTGKLNAASVYSSILQSDLSWQNAEQEMKAAMRAARAGDTLALYEYNMRQGNKRVLPPIEANVGAVEFAPQD